MDNPKISVVTVCYNAVDTIEDTMLSVFSQNYDNIEYIIIDGGSIDGTLDIVKKYSDKVTYWRSEPDKGIYDAMNKGMQIANGYYLLFLNAGDYFYKKDILESISKEFDGKSIIYGNVMMHFDDHNQIYGGKFDKFRLTYENICHQSIFYPKEIFKSFKYDLNYPLLADWVSNLEMWHQKTYKFSPIIVSNYFRGGASDTIPDRAFTKDLKKLIYNNLGLLSLTYYYYIIIKRKIIALYNHTFKTIIV